MGKKKKATKPQPSAQPRDPVWGKVPPQQYVRVFSPVL